MKSGERYVRIEPPTMPPMSTVRMPQMKNRLKMRRSKPDSEGFLHSNCKADSPHRHLISTRGGRVQLPTCAASNCQASMWQQSSIKGSCL